MIYLIRHITGFRYEPEVGESVMEVRLQPRSNTQQRCLTFSLDVNPRATVSVHRDFYGNAVHHFDIPGRHSAIDVIAEATVETLPARDLENIQHSTWEELDENVAAGDYWEMLLPSHFACSITRPTAPAWIRPLMKRYALAAGFARILRTS
jgi:transglutaminase-like putative cysteine protease